MDIIKTNGEKVSVPIGMALQGVRVTEIRLKEGDMLDLLGARIQDRERILSDICSRFALADKLPNSTDYDSRLKLETLIGSSIIVNGKESLVTSVKVTETENGYEVGILTDSSNDLTDETLYPRV